MRRKKSALEKEAENAKKGGRRCVLLIAGLLLLWGLLVSVGSSVGSEGEDVDARKKVAFEDALMICYVAVGRTTLGKAARSALSAMRADPEIKTSVATDVETTAFDVVIPLNGTSMEFAAFRPLEGAAFAAAGKPVDWRSSESEATRAIVEVRQAKTRAFGAFAKLAPVVTLDADTVVCETLRPFVVKVRGADVGFVPVPRDRWHAPKQVDAIAGRRTRGVPEANTGALVLKSKRLTALARDYAVHYTALASAGQLMDQVAFRAALATSNATFATVPSTFNCRGRDSKTRASAALGCDGLPPDVPDSGPRDPTVPEDTDAGKQGARSVEAALASGKGCAVLHSHDVTALRRPLLMSGGESIDLPFSGDASLRRALLDNNQKLTVILRDPLDRALDEYDACCRRTTTSTEQCDADAVDACPQQSSSSSSSSSEGDFTGIAAFAKARGDVALRHVVGALLRPTSPREARLAALTRRAPASTADLRIVVDLLRTGVIVAAVAERPRDSLAVLRPGRRRSDEQLHPPSRSRLRADLGNADLRTIRRAQALDKRLYDAAAALIKDGLRKRHPEDVPLTAGGFV